MVRGRKKPIELLFKLEHPDDLTLVTEVNEEADDDEGDNGETADSNEDELQQRFEKMTFVVGTKKLEQLPQWVKVTDVFKTDSDAGLLKRAGITGFDDPRYEKYSQRLARVRAIRKYVYRMDVLERKLTYDEVTEIFVRVNSLGAKLRSSDLALAQITAKWRGALKIFQSFQEAIAQRGFDLDLGLHVKNVIAFATSQSRFLTVNTLTVNKLQDGWQSAVKGMEFATNFMKNNVGIDYAALLSSPYLLVSLGYFGHKRDYQISDKEASKLRYWVLSANAKGRYSRGSSETLLDQDLATLRDGGGTNELIDRLRLQVGVLEILPGELEGRNQRSALFKTMFLAFRDAGAKDWRSNLSIALDHSGSQHRLQFHHIFPKSLLKNAYTSREADDIANMAFIGGKTNRAISDKAPEAYFPIIIEKAGKKSFEAQCIPINQELLSLRNYKAFLSKRRTLIAAALNRFLCQEEH
jgi:hypothetical protein